MQPYFFPYIGYFQLMNAVDEFVVYDNIEYTKKGWINRNRILVNNQDAYITLNLKKDSDYLHVADRFLADAWLVERKKMLNRITESYRKAPYYKEVYPLIESCILFEETNLFKFIFNSLQQIKNYLEIPAKFVVASTISINHELKSQDKVIAICKARNADTYINPIGGIELYSKDDFKKEGINLQFLKPSEFVYKQLSDNFIPWLSIIDVMMFNSKDDVKKKLLLSYDII